MKANGGEKEPFDITSPTRFRFLSQVSSRRQAKEDIKVLSVLDQD